MLRDIFFRFRLRPEKYSAPVVGNAILLTAFIIAGILNSTRVRIKRMIVVILTRHTGSKSPFFCGRICFSFCHVFLLLRFLPAGIILIY